MTICERCSQIFFENQSLIVLFCHYDWCFIYSGIFMHFNTVLRVFIIVASFFGSSVFAMHHKKLSLEEQQVKWEENYSDYLEIAKDKNRMRTIDLEAIAYFWRNGRRPIPGKLWPILIVKNLPLLQELGQLGL